MYSVGKTCILIGPAFVKYSGLEVACLYYSINRDFRDNTGGNKTKTTKPNNPNSAVNMTERKKREDFKSAVCHFYKTQLSCL